MPRKVRIPEPYAGLKSAGPGDRIAVLHAELNCRTLETFVRLALARAGDVVVATPNVDAARVRLEELLEGIRSRRAISKSFFGRQAGATRVWIAGPDADYADSPFDGVDALFVDGAHRLDRDPGQVIGRRLRGPAVYAGCLPRRGSWFREAVDCGTIDVRARVDADAACRSWPDQAARRLDASDPMYQRLMMLRDDEKEDAEAPPPVSFFRTRLFVKTDKGREYLSPAQQTYAERELGPAWDTGKYGQPVVPFEPTRMQLRYLAMKRLGRRRGFNKFLLLKYRRGGFTTFEQADSYRIVSTLPRSSVATLAHVADSTQRIFQMVKLYHERDPLAPRAITDSRRALDLENRSSFFIGTAGGRGFTRGDTVQKVHGSEVSRWCEGPNQDVDVKDLIAGIIGAASRGEVVMETTPKGVEWFCRTYREAKRGLNDWWPIFLPWYADPTNVLLAGAFDPDEIRDTIDDEEKMLVDRKGLSWAQVAWRRKTKREYRDLFKQEFPEDDETCFYATGSPFFTIEIIERLLRELPEPDPGEVTHYPGGTQTVWEPPKPGVQYVAGVDTSEGLPGRDPCGMGVLRRDTCSQVLELHGLFNPSVLAQHVARIARWYNDALTGVERQNHGHAVLRWLIDNGHGASHLEGGWLFHHPKPHEHTDPDVPARVDASARAGWDTNPVTRPVMLDGLARLIEDRLMHVRSRKLLEEARTFRLQQNGKYEHDPGEHDDCIFFWGIAGRMIDYRKLEPNIF